MRQKRAVFKAANKVLQAERIWLQEVQSTFALNHMDSALQSWKSYVLYQRVRASRRLSLYNAFLTQMRRILDAKEENLCSIIGKLELNKVKNVFDAVNLHRKRSLIKKRG